jgi:hypothetical protein
MSPEHLVTLRLVHCRNSYWYRLCMHAGTAPIAYKIISSRFGSRVGTRTARIANCGITKGYEIGNAVLRPSKEALPKSKVQLSVSHADNESERENPLSSIRIRRDMTWRESNEVLQSIGINVCDKDIMNSYRTIPCSYSDGTRQSLGFGLECTIYQSSKYPYPV